MKKIIVLITTYKRPKHLLALLNDILNSKSGFKVELIIVEDCSQSNYSSCKRFLRENFRNYEWHKANMHHGKEYYWKLITKLYGKVKSKNFDYVVQLPDDARLVNNFFRKATSIWEAISDKNKIALTLAQWFRKRDTCWTPIHNQLVNFNDVNVNKTGWVDMNFICQKRFFDELNYQCPAVSNKWTSIPNRSSGVGMAISKHMVAKGLSFYQVEKSLTIHTCWQKGSQMHPDFRKVLPVFTNHENIIATMATIPERVDSLEKTIESILPQVDQLQIYLNNFEEFPGFLKNKKIKIFKSQNEVGDLGDAGKFYRSNEIGGYHFSIDDDILYPNNYVMTMVHEIEKHERKYVVGTHGRIFGNLPTHSYYHGYTKGFMALGKVGEDAFVHVMGTGALAYHTDTIKLDREDFKASNMADIWFSQKCNKHKIPLLVIKHEKGWLKDIPNKYKDYNIYNFCHNNDTYQTDIINKTTWNKLKRAV